MISEFTVAGDAVPGARPFDTRSPVRWVFSHVRRYPLLLVTAVVGYVLAWALFGLSPIMVGRVAQVVIDGHGAAALFGAALALLLVLLGDELFGLTASMCALTLGHRLERDARDQLYRSLLGKSQTFHNRQRVGDLVARATDDPQHLSHMIQPGLLFMADTVLGFAAPLVYIALLDPRLLLVPGLYVVTFVVLVRAYTRRLGPVLMEQRTQYGRVTAAAEEAISGIEVVKAAVRERRERRRFHGAAAIFRDLFVRQGRIEALYLPMLTYGVAMALALLHGVLLLRAGGIELSELIALVGLIHLLRIPTFMSAFTFSMVQNGIAGARRILAVLTATTELDQNTGGHRATVRGAIAFEGVSFWYGAGADASGAAHTAAATTRTAARTDGSAHTTGSGGSTPAAARTAPAVLTDVEVRIAAGETVAIVGQTGSGKTTLTQLVNRTYDPIAGRITVDGIDLRRWNLSSLRSQIANIEQDVFLFSRSVAENIAFARPGASRADIKAAARAAAAHRFITAFQDGYDTMIGERGVTLSGGQRQRIALARAFLKDPRILILDDSTSAIDSETEDEIQRALATVQRSRTTLIITHRLSQIRWADRILVLAGGRLVAAGAHDELLATSPVYRRIFSRYDLELPPLRGAAARAMESAPASATVGAAPASAAPGASAVPNGGAG